MRHVVFAANNLNALTVGLLIQVILVRFVGMDHISSYVAQAVMSTQMNFLLSRYVTMHDRNVPFLRALAGFDIQLLPITGLGIAEYAGLERLAVNYIVANIAVSVLLAPANFLSSHKLPMNEQTRHRWRVATILLPLLVALAVASVAVTETDQAVSIFPPVRGLIYAVWLVPLAELAMLVAGQLNYRLGFRRNPGKFRLLIIQVTTTGREQERVNEIIGQIRSYSLQMPYELWVATEPNQGDSYPLADRVIVVPASFTARSERKARALEFTRQMRGALELDRPDVKILYNDDDVLPTKGYIETAFAADYDVCEGITAPRTEYGTRPLSHVITSHVDDVRARQCLIYCSVFQGLIGKPLYVHGEGLTVTGECERIVTWNYPVFASEDLTFGQNAAKMGMRWGWFHEHVELTSPWTLKDFFIQRKRWLWGNIHAITHREVLPGTRALAIALKYVVDSAIFLLSTIGVLMRLTGHLPSTSPVYDVSKLSLLTWLTVFFGTGWIGASGSQARRNDDSRLLNALMAVVLSPLSCLITTAGLIYPLIAGNPRTFEVIRKTRVGTR